MRSVPQAGPSNLGSLTRLWLSNTAVSDEGLKTLHGMKGLRWVIVGGTKVTEKGIAALRQAIPQVKTELREK